MAFNYVGFINGEWSATAAKKTAMLADFCYQYGYEDNIPDPASEDPEATIPNPVSKTSFANDKIEQYIIQTVNAYRKDVAEAAASFEELDLT